MPCSELGRTKGASERSRELPVPETGWILQKKSPKGLPACRPTNTEVLETWGQRAGQGRAAAYLLKFSWTRLVFM